MDEMNEAFRAEINSLTEENAHLKQIGRERDRELSDQRDKNEELSSRIENLEKERNLLVNNVSSPTNGTPLQTCGLASAVGRHDSGAE